MYAHALFGESLTKLVHVHMAGSGGDLEHVVVDELLGPDADGARQPSPAVSPRPGQDGKTAQRAEEHGPLLVVFGADEGAQERRLGGAIGVSEALDFSRIEAAYLAGPLGCPFGDSGGQLVVAGGMTVDVVVVDEVVADQYMHDGQHQGDIGAGERLDEPVGRIGGHRADGIDDHDLGTVGPGLLDEGPQMAVGKSGVGGPQDDELGETDIHGVGTPGGAIGRRQTRPGGGPAQRPGLAGGTEAGEETAIERRHLDESLGAGVKPGNDGFASVLLNDLAQPDCHHRQCLVPGGLPELPGAFRPGTDQRVENPIGMVDTVEETVDLGAQLAPGVGVVEVATQLDSPAVLDGRHPSTGIWTVMVAGAEHDAGGHGQSVMRPLLSMLHDQSTAPGIDRQAPCRP